MQTTLRLDKDLYREAKAQAAKEDITLTQFIEDAIRMRLMGEPVRGAVHIRTYRAGEPLRFDVKKQPLPGV